MCTKWIGLLFVAIGPLFSDSQPGDIERVNLTILTFNDIYDVNPQNGHLGAPGLKTLLDRERANSDHYITTVNGDFLSPSIYSSVYKGKHMIEIFNLLEVDAVTFGNHEFDFGAKVLKDRIKESNFVWLGTNVLDTHTGLPFADTESTVMFQMGNINFGLIGLTTTETAELSNSPRDVIFAPVILSAQAAVHKLKKKGADVVIAMTHLYVADDIMLARNVPEIDVILGGHDHEPMAFIEGNTLIYKAGMDGKFLGRIDLLVEKKNSNGRMKTTIYPSYRLISNHGHESDHGIREKLEQFKKFVDLEASTTLGVVIAPISTKNVRFGENAFANLVADALRKDYDADVAIINGGAIRGSKEYPVGYAMTRIDIQAELPFGNIAVLTEISGENLFQAIEYALSKVEEHNGSFLHFSGMRVVYDSKSSAGNRIREILIKGQPVDRTAMYKVATIDYLLKGGDGNFWFANGKTLIGGGSGKIILDVVASHIKQLGMINSVLEGRIVELSDSKETKLIDLSDNKRIQLHS